MGCLSVTTSRIGGISASATRIGGISVAVGLVCSTDIGANIYLLAAGDGSLLMTLDGGYLSFKKQTQQ